ncbi:MAG: hypothetical protein ACTSQI_12145 [Candidatus Helarchaeota archaeon]
MNLLEKISDTIHTIEDGFDESITDIIYGFIVTAILAAFLNSQLYPLEIIRAIEVGFLILSVVAVFQMESWGIFYSIGWIGGQAIGVEAGLVEGWLFAVHLGGLIGTIILKIYKKTFKS